VRENWAVGRLELTEPAPAIERRAGAVLTVRGGRLGLAEVGEGLRLTGRLELTRFGEQFEIEGQESLGVQSNAQAHRWLERLDGVGPVIARRIYERYGEGVLELLKVPPPDGHPDPLCEVEGLGPTAAQTIRESWGRLGASGNPEDLRYLDGLGLTRYEVNSVIAYAKTRAITPRDLLATDPYSITDVKGFGWKKTDIIARKAGAAANAPTRLDTAAIYATGELCDGDTLVQLGRLVAETAKLTGCDEGLCLDGIARMARADRLVITQDDRGTRWVHPPELVMAERAIWRVLQREAEERALFAQAERERAASQGAQTTTNTTTTNEEPAAVAAKETEWKPSGVVEPWEGP
ncbi:MAG TPA: helix-hairpin-helix domain-containing protein, partial [Anaeromyxobacteraceae bacterium]|nr:helix-hairpin-helix domain-containing protein [Anaeromyxobacteraceae bacterium]